MSFSGLFIRAMLPEMRHEVSQARIDKIHNYQNEVHFYLRSYTGKQVLVVSIDSRDFRLQLASEKPPVTYPAKPSSFCMLLRRHVIGLPLTAISQPGLERVVTLTFTGGYGENLKPQQYQLVCELMGRNSNIILLDPEKYILGAARTSSLENNQYREVLPGAQYIPPPARSSKDLLSIDSPYFRRSLLLAPPQEQLAQTLLTTLQGIDRLISEELLIRTGLKPDLLRKELRDYQLTPLWQEVLSLQERVSQNTWTPTLFQDDRGKRDYAPIPLSGTSTSYDTFQELLEFCYSPTYQRQERALSIADLETALKKEVKRVKRRIRAQEQDYRSASAGEEYKSKADLLMAYLHTVKSGSIKVSLPAFEDGELVDIELDPTKRPVANAKTYYTKYAKAKRKRERSLIELEKSKERLSYLEQLQEDLRQQESPEDLNSVAEELSALGLFRSATSGKSKTQSRKAGPQFKRVSLADGTEVLIGRNSKQNDHVTMVKARPEDLWFHVKNLPGSHVILRVEGNQPPTQENILAAAQLAATYSKGFQSSKVEVDFTQRKHVWKPKGAKPGMVLYENYQTLFVAPLKEGTF